jgi:polyphenol oxidase
MIYIKQDRIGMYFGDAQDKCLGRKSKPQQYQETCEAFSSIQKGLEAKSLTFLTQTHGTQGYVVDLADGMELFERNGDFLCTNVPGAAIGVLTADCLPIICYDPVHHACCVIHAGWRGSVARIGPTALALMQQQFGTNARDVIVYFGPSALSCCYQVGQDFYDMILKDKTLARYAEQVFVWEDNVLRFDNGALNFLMFVQAGVLAHNMHTDYSKCTICNGSFHSFRRDGEWAGRQATVVVLR